MAEDRKIATYEDGPLANLPKIEALTPQSFDLGDGKRTKNDTISFPGGDVTAHYNPASVNGLNGRVSPATINFTIQFDNGTKIMGRSAQGIQENYKETVIDPRLKQWKSNAENLESVTVEGVKSGDRVGLFVDKGKVGIAIIGDDWKMTPLPIELKYKGLEGIEDPAKYPSLSEGALRTIMQSDKLKFPEGTKFDEVLRDGKGNIISPTETKIPPEYVALRDQFAKLGEKAGAAPETAMDTPAEVGKAESTPEQGTQNPRFKAIEDAAQKREDSVPAFNRKGRTAEDEKNFFDARRDFILSVMDTNGDKKIDKNEMNALDPNKDGKITPQERADFLEKYTPNDPNIRDAVTSALRLGKGNETGSMRTAIEWLPADVAAGDVRTQANLPNIPSKPQGQAR